MNDNLCNEQWKQIEDFPNYEVSSKGNVRNIKTQRILKPTYHWNGYIQIGINKDGKLHTKLVHRLVAKAFINNPEDKPTVDHINGNKNLRWATYKEQGIFNNHKGHCSDYKKEIMKKYYETHNEILKEKNKEKAKRYYEANRERNKEKRKEYYEANRERIKEYIKRYREENKERLKEYHKEYNEANKEKIKEYKRLYYLKHKLN